MISQHEKAQKFQSLHENGNFFILPNPWDVGSAKLMSSKGFNALATTSAGFAMTLGKKDYQLSRDELLVHIQSITQNSDLPLTADLENGFGDPPEVCAQTIKLGAQAGLVGGSIEDFTRNSDAPQYDITFAKERVAAAVEAANSLDFPFMLTARAENFFTGIPNLKDTILRLQAYQEAGAHVLYAPALRTLDEIKTVLSEVDRPLNVLLGPMTDFVNMQTLKDIGVTRVSMGPVLMNNAYSGLLHSLEQLSTKGELTPIMQGIENEGLKAATN